MKREQLFNYCLEFIQKKCPYSPSALKSANMALTQNYRSKTSIKNGFGNDLERFSYLFARFPSTFNACLNVFEEIPKDLTFQSVLDIGSGPGTASLALSLYSQNPEITLLEQDQWMCTLSKELLGSCHIQANYINSSLFQYAAKTHDLCILSYVLGELSKETQKEALLKAAALCQKAIIIIAPGTPQSFQDLLTWREVLKQQGFWIAAPCPHQEKCPLSHDDWCHFKARVSRSKMHRYLKDANLSFDDEPYCYLIAIKDEELLEHYDRLLCIPKKRSKHFYLKICSYTGKCKQEIITKNNPFFTRLKKSQGREKLDASS